jgi:hypothetical protein
VSQSGTYTSPEKTSITKGSCAVDLAGSDAILQNDAGTRGKVWRKSDTRSSVSVHVANENPGERAGSAGAMQIEQAFKTEYCRLRAKNATALCHAIAECDPQDACEIMVAAFEDLSIGMPIAPLFSVMDGAGFWADLATQDELKAYTLACFTLMTPRNKAAFLGYVGGLQ